jgi:SPP1 gp7 family putative phage head morphogenesis protein
VAFFIGIKMNIFQSLGYGLGYIQSSFMTGLQKSTDGWARLEAIFNQQLGSSLGSSSNRKQSPTLQLQEYQSWIYIILTTIYGRTSTVPWNLFKDTLTETPEKLENQRQHPLYKLLMKPNPFMTGTFLQQFVQMSLDLTGMAFIWKNRNGLGKPAELWPLNVSEFVDFIPGETTKEFIKGYRFNQMVFDREDIIYLFYPNPDATFFSSLGTQKAQDLFASLAGMSPVQAMNRTVDIEKYIEIYQRDFFENSARPDVILTTRDGAKFDEKTRERFLTKWRQKHQGVNKSHEPTVLTNMDITTLKATNKDFEFARLAGWTKDMLFAAYSVPEGKAGLVKDVNRANQVGIEITFNQECVRPRLDLWDETLTIHLAHEFDERLIIKHDNPVPSDNEFNLKKQEADTKSFVRTINEIREEQGLESVEWGNEPWIPFNLIQPAGVGEEEAQPEIPEALETPVPIEEPEKQSKGEGNRFLVTEQAKVAFWKQFDARARKHERAFIKMLRPLFRAQEKEVLKNLEGLKNEIEAQFAGWSNKKIARFVQKNPRLIKQILFDEKKARKTFEAAGEPLIADAFEESGAIALTDLGLDINFDLENKRARKFIGDKTAKFAKEVNDTTAKELAATLKQGFADGESVSKLASRVRKVYDKADTSRSIMIARTEIIASSNAGTLEGFEQSGVVQEKEWLSSRDERVRESHLPPLDGQVVKLKEDFTSNDGNQAPAPGAFGLAEEDVQCRCTIIAVVK